MLLAAILQPHRIRTFTFSPDPDFEAKLLDIVGLYLNPPENAFVLCVDEKPSIQALDRTQPLLPLSAKKPRAWTNEYARHGPKHVWRRWPLLQAKWSRMSGIGGRQWTF